MWQALLGQMFSGTQQALDKQTEANMQQRAAEQQRAEGAGYLAGYQQQPALNRFASQNPGSADWASILKLLRSKSGQTDQSPPVTGEPTGPQSMVADSPGNQSLMYDPNAWTNIR